MLGFFSFTEVTDPCGHRPYNEWHQLDHLPEQFSIEGITFGQRWVCSPRCLEERVAVSPLLAPCHYITLYLLRDAEVLPEFFALAEQLREADRFFKDRVAHLSGPFEVVGQWASARVGVSGAAVPFRPAQGVYVVVGAESLEIDPTQMVEVPGVAGAWQFAESGAGRHITVAFVDGDLWAASAQLGEYCRQLEAPLEWAGPLQRVDPFEWDWFS